MMLEAFQTLQVMFYEATACHVTTELSDLIRMFQQCILSPGVSNEVIKEIGMTGRADLVQKLALLLNSFVPVNVRMAALGEEGNTSLFG